MGAFSLFGGFNMRRTFNVEGMTCSNCAKAIENAFKLYKGVEVKINVSANKASFKYDEEKYNPVKLAKIVEGAGYKLIIEDALSDNKRIRSKMKIELLVSILFSLPLLIGMFGHLEWFNFLNIPKFFGNGYFQLFFATVVQVGIGRRFYLSAYKALKNKVLGMDALVVLGTTSAYLYSLYTLLFNSGEHHVEYFFEISALIITMVLIGNYIEHIAKEKTSDALVDLVNLAAKEARVIVKNQEVMKPIAEVVVGDEVIVLANEKIPVDGLIIEGSSNVDESSFTGESIPAAKKVGEYVIGSTINLSEKLIVKTTKVGSDTLLAKIIETVEDASINKSPIQRVADKVAQYFVPFVVIVAILNFLVQFHFFGIDGIEAFKRTIAILVISCPCALGLATPTSILVGNGLAAKNHILYRGGEFFEIANKIEVVCFDKTGTLTQGKPEVTDYIGNEVYNYVYSIEKDSTHPISKAVVNYMKPMVKKEYVVKDFEVIQGKGLKAKLNRKNVYIGSIKMVEDLKLNIGKFADDYSRLINEVKTVNFVIINDKIEAIYGVRDEIKPTSKAVIEEMKHRGIKPVMITGDNKTVATQIARELGIEDFYAEVLPKDKSDIVKELGKDRIIAFVGDGVNDAPALEIADVGFAMGDGTDIAINSSDVTLLSNDLKMVIYAIDISNATLKNIYQNFLWAFSYNLIAIPLAALGYLSMALSASAMAFSSIMVVLNALRLRRFKLQDFNAVPNSDETEIAVKKVDENGLKEKNDSEGETTMKLKIEDMTCGHCTARITKILEENDAKNINCDLETKEVTFENANLDKVVEEIKEAGYNPVKM